MTVDMQTAHTAAQLRQAVQDLAKLAVDAQPDGADGIGAWAELARDLADRYHVHLDGLDARRRPRYVAIARSLDVRPYAVVTSDPQELRDALLPGDGTPSEPFLPEAVEAMRVREVMAQLRYDWGDAYVFAARGGRYTSHCEVWAA